MSGNGKRFEITRSDGRSDARVIIDMVGDAEPDQIFTYTEIAEELGAKSPRKYTVEGVQAAVARAAPRLLREKCRALVNVRNIGYRIAKANEHSKLAIDRKRRADSQMTRGLQIMQQVRLDELTPHEKQMQEAQCILWTGMIAYVRAQDARLNYHDKMIGKIAGKLDIE